MKERIEYLDIMKGIGIILVVLGHVSKFMKLNYWIYAFHMPLFFFISGYVYCISKKTKFIRKRIVSLLIPYFIFSLISFAYWFFLERSFRSVTVSGWQAFQSIFLAQGGDVNYPYNISLWFLPCLFVTEILFHFVIKPLRNDFVLVAALVAASVIGYCFPLLLGFHRFPWSMDTMFVAVAFYGAGYLISKYRTYWGAVLRSRRIRYLPLFFVVFTLSVGLVFCNGGVDMNNEVYGNYFLFYVSALNGILCVFLLSNVVHSPIINFWGENTLLIMCIHEPIKRVVIQILSKLLSVGTDALRMNLIFCFLVTGLLLCIMVPIIKFVNYYMPYLLGRKILIQKNISSKS